MSTSVRCNASAYSVQEYACSASASTGKTEVLQPPSDSDIGGPRIPNPLHAREQRIAIPCFDKEPTSSVDNDSRSSVRTTSRTPTEQTHNTSKKTPERFWFRCCGAFFALFTAGWADGVTGAILPHIKEDFNLSYMLSSLLFVTSTFGFALGIIMIEHVMCLLGSLHFDWIEFPRPPSSWGSRETRKRERGPSHVFTEENRIGDKRNSPSRARFRILVIASILHASFFILMGTANGLSNVLVAYFIAALGKALLNGTVNAYVASSPKRPLGQLYACNSIGAFAAPLVCQTLLARGIPWTHFYLGSLVLSAINTTLLALAFRPTRNDNIEEGFPIITGPHANTQLNCNSTGLTETGGTAVDRTGTALCEKSLSSNSSSPSPSLAGQRDRSCLRPILRLRYVWAFSFFMLIYSGSETATQGYMATYLLAVRNANPNTVGYVTSGFWGGMAITRFITGFASPYLSFTQRKHIIHFILIFALSMHLCIWFIDSVFENAFSTGVIGLLYGPVYPSVLALAVDLLPSEVHMIGMAIIAGFSNLGSSIFPFLCGALSNLRGPKVLVYMTVSQTVTLIILWVFFPTRTPLHQ